MKINRSLPETDLARVALLPTDQKYLHLRRVRDFKVSHSWTPVRKALPAIWQARKSLFVLPDASFSDVENAIKRSCRRHADWVQPNINLARLMYDDVKKRRIKSVEWNFGLMPVGFGASVKFWPDFYSIDTDQISVSLIDPRRGHGLTKLARTFVFSAMHHHITSVADFRETKFSIMTFPTDKETDERSIRRFDMTAEDLVDLPTLTAAIQETYAVWRKVFAEREEEARKTAPTGTDGLFK